MSGNLKGVLEGAAKQLEELQETLKAKPAKPLQEKLIAKYGDLSYPAVRVLREAAAAIPLRALALRDLRALSGLPLAQTGREGEQARDDPFTVMVGKEPFPFNSLRRFRLQSYLATTWGIYDRVCPPIARMIYPDERAESIYKPTLIHFVSEGGDGKSARKSIDGTLYDSLSCPYGWPVAFSYHLRNCFVHEPATPNTVKPFRNIERANQEECFFYKSEHLDELKDGCNYSRTQGKSHERLTPAHSRFEEGAWPTEKEDLVTLLEQCHDECDEALSILVQWSVNAFCDKARLLLQPYGRADHSGHKIPT